MSDKLLYKMKFDDVKIILVVEVMSYVESPESGMPDSRMPRSCTVLHGVCKCKCICICMCMGMGKCLCMWEREKERTRGGKRDRERVGRVQRKCERLLYTILLLDDLQTTTTTLKIKFRFNILRTNFLTRCFERRPERNNSIRAAFCGRPNCVAQCSMGLTGLVCVRMTTRLSHGPLAQP